MLKDAPKLDSQSVDRVFAGLLLLGPDRTLPPQTKYFENQMKSFVHVVTSIVFRAPDLVEWYPKDLSSFWPLEEYPNAASKVRRIRIPSIRVREFAKYARCCPNLMVLGVTVKVFQGDVWGLVTCFPELHLDVHGTSSIFGSLIGDGDGLQLPRRLRICVSVRRLDIPSADLDNLRTIIERFNWTIELVEYATCDLRGRRKRLP